MDYGGITRLKYIIPKNNKPLNSKKILSVQVKINQVCFFFREDGSDTPSFFLALVA